MTLSVCLIVRDEATRLAAALASVRAVADEVVVVDTGSTDGTPALAASLGASVASFAWIDDFAAARNHSFSLARGEWILSLDADERLEAPAPLRKALRKGDAYRVKIVDGGVESWRVRLFRRAVAPPMVGRIHEFFDPPLPARDSSIRLLHEGYASGPSEAKHQRNLPLLALELAARPDRLDVRIERARTLMAKGDSSALDACLAFVDPAGPRPIAHVAMLLEAFLSRPPAARPSWLHRPAADALVERWFPLSPPLRWVLAREAAEAGDFAAARVHLERLVGMAERRDYDRSLGFDARLLGPEPRLQLGGVFVRMGLLDDAEQAFAALASDPVVGAAAAANLAVARGLRGA